MIKYTLIMALGFLFGWAILSDAQTIDLATPETRISVSKYKITDIIIHQNTKQAIVTIVRGYDDSGNFIVVDEFDTIFQNVVDDPDTAEDETDNSYTQFLANIGIKGSLIKSAVRTKIGK